MTSLTQDSIQLLVQTNANQASNGYHPVVQCVQVKPVQTNANKDNNYDNAKKRYRVVLSDGKYFCQAMVASQQNKFIESGQLSDYSIIRIGEYMVNIINNMPVLILLTFDILNNPGQQLGDPKDITKNPPMNGAGGHVNGVQQPIRANTFVKPEQSNNNPYNHTAIQNNYGSSSSSAPIMRTTTPSSSKLITPIAQLNMYQNRWTIKARVTSKSAIRTWSNAKGEGQLFSIELLDSSSDIRATFFREAVDKFHPMLEVDNVYTFSGGKLKAANMQYNTCKSSFEITFDQNAEICKENDTGDIQQQNYNFVPIAQLEDTEPGGFVDVVGVVKRVSDPATIMSKKSNRELTKCELTIGDDSGADVSVTIWGDRANNALNEFGGNPVVAFRRARISDYGGRTLSASNDGIIANPRVIDTERLHRWWSTGGSSAGPAKSLSSSMGGGASRFPKFEERKPISSIKGEGLGLNSGEKPDWISFKGTFSFIKSDRDGGAWYPACKNAEEPCKNRVKVTKMGDGEFFCERCQRQYEECVYRYIFSASVSDDTSSSWVSLFDEQATTLLGGISANELHEILENGSEGESVYNGHFYKATFTEWIFTCKVKQEVANGEMRIKTSVHSLHPVDYAKEGRSLLNSILSM